MKVQLQKNSMHDACLVNAQEIDADWQQFEDPYQWQIRPAR